MGDGANAELERRYPEAFGGRSGYYPPPLPAHHERRVPGTRATLDLLRQTQFHVTKDGTVIKPEDMSPRHRGNTVRLGERRAENLRAALLSEALDQEWGLQTIRNIHATPDMELVHEFPLFARMIELGIE